MPACFVRAGFICSLVGVETRHTIPERGNRDAVPRGRECA
nr:MAG TPA: hypothetical protein [Caudoviricetes sp.]